MQATLAFTGMMAIAGALIGQAADAEVASLISAPRATDAIAPVNGIALSAAHDVRYRGERGVHTEGRNGGFHRRPSSSMLDFYPAGDGFRISAGLRFDPKRPKGALASMANGAVKAMDGGSARERVGVARRSTPAMTVGYGVSMDEHTQFGIEAGALIDRKQGPMTLDAADPVGSARSASQRLAGKGQAGLGEVIRVSFATRF